ncbi:Mut7-C RNAse domain-containing protein [Halalkalirubrum salinum]|uniref:Mut7-C RNAse domain-containing protein n=1 Tax=Halalkalirubrum salinum TaxID=2563889 RepID=UPI0010FB8E36|nr:Mut7-C RNAse domain-containing protein [Halalkalirubrum salinum]
MVPSGPNAASSTEPTDRSQRFLVDAMFGTLVTYLRMCGYDTVYGPDIGVGADDRLRQIAKWTDRTLLTRDRELAERTDGSIFVASTALDEQLRSIAAAGVDLTLPAEPQYCGRCNGHVTRFCGDSVPEYAPEDRRLWACESCGQLFWKGSHWADVRDRLQAIRKK